MVRARGPAMSKLRILIHAGTITYSSDPIDENGASCIVWDGSSLADALTEQATWEAGE